MCFWGGLRGSLSIALVLSLPEDLLDRSRLVLMVLGTVLISLLGQGLTVGPLLKRLKLVFKDSSEDQSDSAQANPGTSALAGLFRNTLGWVLRIYASEPLARHSIGLPRFQEINPARGWNSAFEGPFDSSLLITAEGDLMKTISLATSFALALTVSIPASAQSMSDLTNRLVSATQVIHEIEGTPDGGIPDMIVSKADCIAVIPSVKKGAFVVGASYGQGVVTCRTPKGWSAPVFIRLAGASFGFQIGGQATDLILVAVNDKGFQDLLKSKVKIGADASAAAGPVGRHAAVGTDVLLNAELLTYSRAKGVFAGIDLNGAVVSQNTDDTNLFYGGHAKTYEQILRGDVAVPNRAKRFVRTVARYFHSTR